MIAALYVAANGPYFGIDGIDPYDVSRDARNYDGPHSVIAHPPCERWGRYWSGGPNPNARRFEFGSDDGCFQHAISCVRKFGGVLEHPEASHAFQAHGIDKPPRQGKWWLAGDGIGYVCCVMQGHYGHKAQKATWLYANVPWESLPELTWGPCANRQRLDAGYHSKEAASAAREGLRFARQLAKERGERITDFNRLSAIERVHTPLEFRDLLIGIARQACVKRFTGA